MVDSLEEEADPMVKMVDVNLIRQIWTKARPSGKVKVHLEAEAVTTEVVIAEEVSEELVKLWRRRT